MQGKESDKKDLKLSALLALCILFALMAAGLMGCSKSGKNNFEITNNWCIFTKRK
jgi:hypothetical protein